MASNRQNPASHSDPDADVVLATRVRRQAATGPAGQPGTIRVVAIEGDAVHESEGAAALAASARAPRPSRTRRSGSTSSAPTADSGQAGRRGPRPPPADRRGRPRGQPAGQDRDDQRHRPHRPVPPELRRRRRRVRARYRARTRVPPDRPQRRTGTRGTGHHLAEGVGPVLKHGPDHLLWAIADDLDRWLLPVRRPHRRRHRRRPGPGRPQGDPGHRRAAVQAQARAHPGPPRDQPGPRGLQPADEPRRAGSSTTTSSSTSATSTTT